MKKISMRKIEVFDRPELNAAATIALNMGRIARGWYFENAVKRETPYRSVYEFELTDEYKELISDMILEYGYDIVNNVFMDLYMTARAEGEQDDE